MGMFCYQCEQTHNGTGCTVRGVCGKDETIAKFQDVIVYGLRGLAIYANKLREFDITDRESDVFILESLFTTVTNVNYDVDRHSKVLAQLKALRDRLKDKYEEIREERGLDAERLADEAYWEPALDKDGILRQAEEVGILNGKSQYGDDITGLREMLTYGLKGMAAYAEHAQRLGHESEEVYAFFEEMLALLTRKDLTVDILFDACMRCGQMNLKVMGLLDEANTGTYGHPEPTQVRVTPVKGKAIVVSGHDLRDLDDLLKQTEGKGINVYTHGEMLPCLAYPGLKKYPHLVGNYGGAWQNQQKEFSKFPGAILMTTNCLQQPQKAYHDRIFTTNAVGWPGIPQIEPGPTQEAPKDFSPVIEAALAAEGFTEDDEPHHITIGFARNTVLSVADKVIDAVKNGALRHIFLIGGCDGAKLGRSYYTEFAESVPKDCAIMTLACGKYRFNKLEFGDIGGIPRLLDAGQCNDAYSAVQVAVALANAFNTDVNSLPLSFIITWYEQKAVAVLLTLLSLGIKDIRLGPSLPAFATPAILNVLAEKFNIMPIKTPQEDLQAILGQV